LVLFLELVETELVETELETSWVGAGLGGKGGDTRPDGPFAAADRAIIDGGEDVVYLEIVFLIESRAVLTA
jgi:hypothetical protein